MSRHDPAADNPPEGSGPGAGRIRIALAGGHNLVRAGLRLLLESQSGYVVVALGTDSGDEPAAIADSRPDVILLDDDDHPDSAVKRLRDVFPDGKMPPVLVVTARGDSGSARAVVLAGARGIVTKDKSGEFLLHAIRKVHEGELWIDRAVTAQLVVDMTDRRAGEAANAPPDPLHSVSPRERDVIALVGIGCSNKAIAARLGISDNTVRHHLTSIFAKLGVPDRLALVLYAYRHRLAGPAPK